MIAEAQRNHILTPLTERGPITPIPDFDVLLADEVRTEADQFVKGKLKKDSKHFPSLKIATALSLYNFRHSSDYNPTAEIMLFDRLESLIDQETAASNPKNPLPPIGVEVETPQLPYYGHSEIYTDNYAQFFDVIGMPRNKENQTSGVADPHFTYWEFSPQPSFSSAVQKRIISELVQGYFVPSLTSNSKNPDDIAKYLDPNLISLHINIGLPYGLPAEPIYRSDQKELLGIVLALAYTSPKRILDRKSGSSRFAIPKQGTSIEKKFGEFSQERIELKAMEVRSEDTYRALDAAQLMFGAFFDSLRTEPKGIGSYWKEIYLEICTILDKYGFKNETDSVAKNIKVGNLAQNTEISAVLRKLINRNTLLIKREIQKTGSE